MRQLFYITHADVVQDPAIPVTDWPLSERGKARHRALAARMPPLGAVFSSLERKAQEGAQILAEAQGLWPRGVLFLHENDRSATGYLPPEEFEAVADAFFARPRDSVRGWERAIDAQYRITTTLKRIVPESREGDVAVVAHGGVGALLRAHLLDAPIDRSHDQPLGKGGGHVLTIALPDWTLVQDWTPIESFRDGPR
ncbi:histidine phosphatase family protein [Thetidibacter halocola]|uniref:Histidine phosphatase family protein n=1 Tax=Thetidibacter halocola TaxID=2827239 RepID=A0A8J8B951_9RHOB|nr:histidine phosphatase family protein [Thetidibacter halocola]MBS0126122.1 histidine phosphatase family protein [Thetidibacter halocola]